MHARLFAAAFAALVAMPAFAGESFYVFRTLEDPSVYADCPAGDTVRLGAVLYAPRTRASDGLVMKEPGKPVGTAIGCGKLLTYTPFDTQVQSPFAMRFELPDATYTASGTCTITSLTFPIPGLPAPLLVVGCSLRVDSDASQGVVNGIATSSSVFTPVALPGYGTGSVWTLHLYTQN